jgi:hypothetical protein
LLPVATAAAANQNADADIDAPVARRDCQHDDCTVDEAVPRRLHSSVRLFQMWRSFYV